MIPQFGRSFGGDLWSIISYGMLLLSAGEKSSLGRCVMNGQWQAGISRMGRS